MTRNVEAIKKQEKILREKLFLKTGDLLNQLLQYVPTSTVVLVNDTAIKVICGADGKKSLLINNRPLATADDCEWVIENFTALHDKVEELMNPEAEELITVIEKTEELIRRVENLTEGA